MVTVQSDSIVFYIYIFTQTVDDVNIAKLKQLHNLE